MPSANVDATTLPLAIATLSLGRAWVHDLPEKLAAASHAGYTGVEIFWEDLVYAAKQFVSDKEANDLTSLAKNERAMLQASHYARDLCDQNHLKIIVLQPFMNYEGQLDDEKHRQSIAQLKLFFQVVKVLGTDLIQVSTQFASEGTTGDVSKIVADMREIGELGLLENPPVRFCYEAMAWGTHLDTWEQVWDIVERVDLPNFGTLLDSFQVLARIWANPTSSKGVVFNCDEVLTNCLSEMRRIAKDLGPKLFLVQLCDGERLAEPLSPKHPWHDATMKPVMQWSRNARLFPGEEDKGGYLPVKEWAKVLFEDVGYRGWVSMEVYSRTLSSPEKDVPENHAQRGIVGWNRLLVQMGYKSRWFSPYVYLLYTTSLFMSIYLSTIVWSSFYRSLFA